MNTRRWPGDGQGTEEKEPTGLPHGTVLGCAHGIPGFNNNYQNNSEAKSPSYDGSNFVDNLCTGMKWQCVEYARRYWMLTYGVVIPSVSWAAHIWSLPHISRKSDHAIVPLEKFPNFGNVKPAVGDLLIYASTPNQRVGHVAVVVEVVSSNGVHSVRVAEQNQENNVMWPGNYADELYGPFCYINNVSVFK